mmetsp:Transcript_84721/g.133810  ORF Transcript_84721/g.133810 Transcript_84721/m.133810 type:complete len:337 (+) Transcript_84721:29-1039(+)
MSRTSSCAFMSKGKVRPKTKHGLRSAMVDAEVVKAYWCRLPDSEKRHILEFKDAGLVQRLFMIWRTLSISDLTCYACGIPSINIDSKKICNDLFAIHGYISPDGALHEAAFYARPALIGDGAFFDLIEQRLGSPLLDGRIQLERSDWQKLFATSPNSWSDFLCKLFHLVELAVCTAHVEACSSTCSSGELCKVSQGAKRRARKKRVNLKMRAEEDELQKIVNACAVCDGSGMLLGDSCPLCEGDSDGAESYTQASQVPNLITHFKSTPLNLTRKWESRWRFARNSPRPEDWQWVLPAEKFTECGISASVKNTFIHASPLHTQNNLSRSRSMPCLSS